MRRGWRGKKPQHEPIPPSDEIDPHEPDELDDRRFVFLSYTAADEGSVRSILVPILRQALIDFHLANRSQPKYVSGLYRQAILRSLARCKYFIVFVSPATLTSKWVMFEVEWASIHRKPNHCLVVANGDVNPTDLNPWLGRVPFARTPSEIRQAVSQSTPASGRPADSCARPPACAPEPERNARDP